jgi:TorA maturation chaperone TorD
VPDLDPAAEAAKANLYLLLSRAFSSPLATDPGDAEWLRHLSSDLPERLRDAASSAADAWEQGLQRREELALSYARLFLGPFTILASPYASFYLEPDQGLMGPVSQAVASAYTEAGLDPGPGPREAPDHAALEWEFMYFMTHQFLVTGDEEWLERRRAFVSTHLARWMPSFARAISHAGEHEFYNALASLLAKLLEDPDEH